MVQQLHAKVPTADKEGFIAIDPEPEELQAFDYLIRHLAGVLSGTRFRDRDQGVRGLAMPTVTNVARAASRT
ncbi:MAG: hypothetical protein R3A10_16560 [Caldilineaceae bacterium]